MCAEIVVTVILNHVTITSHIISGRVNSFFFHQRTPKNSPQFIHIQVHVVSRRLVCYLRQQLDQASRHRYWESPESTAINTIKASGRKHRPQNNVLLRKKRCSVCFNSGLCFHLCVRVSQAAVEQHLGVFSAHVI